MKADSMLDYAKTTTRLLGNALRYRYARLTGAPLKPEAISLALTNRCNSRCIMCNIWKQAQEIPGIKNLELKKDEVIDLFSQPLFSNLVELDLTGGEPHLRDDLADIVAGIVNLKNSQLPRLQTIVITSNGLLPERVIANYRKILGGMKGSGIDLVTVASLDGIGETHDKVRGVPGAYGRAIRTIDGLLELRERYPDYYIGVKTTVLPVNIDSLDAILDFALERHLFTIISPVFFTETRFRNIEKSKALELGNAEHEKLLKFYNRDGLETNYFYSRIRDSLATNHRSWSCTAAYNYLFIEYDGTVYPCELLSEPVGNIREQSPEEIWNGTPTRKWRRRINKTAQCRRCIEPGAVRYSAVAEGFGYLSFLCRLGRHRYRQSLNSEGYVKYLAINRT
jgi:MoaA/NifB/PqqE/SkfB family radical SAM enzyme